jgi:hypothetical protein
LAQRPLLPPLSSWIAASVTALKTGAEKHGIWNWDGDWWDDGDVEECWLVRETDTPKTLPWSTTKYPRKRIERITIREEWALEIVPRPEYKDFMEG